MDGVNHGGHSFEAAADLGLNLDAILDFSANINPLGPPAKVRQLFEDSQRVQELIVNYPQEDYQALKKAISEKFGVSEEEIVVGNGATELLSHVVRQEKMLLLPQPCYGEYEAVCKKNKVEICHIGWFDLTRRSKRFEELIAYVNPTALMLPLPNNPTADLPPLKVLQDYLNYFPSIHWIVDASFLLFSEACDAYWEILKHSEATVVMSLTKYYSLPGLRLGWLFSRGRAEEINKSLDPWRVNALAAEAGTLALGDSEFARESKEWLKTEKKFVYENWSRLGTVTPDHIEDNHANFFMLELESEEKKQQVLEALYQKGILMRDAANFNHAKSLRLAIKGHEDNVKLLKAFEEAMI